MKKYWNGEHSLTKTFWLLWIAGSLIVAILAGIFAYIGSTLFQVSGIQLGFVTFLLVLSFNPYYIFCWVSVWRSANNAEKAIFHWGAKALVLFHTITVVYDVTQIPEIVNQSF